MIVVVVNVCEHYERRLWAKQRNKIFYMFFVVVKVKKLVEGHQKYYI